MQGTARWIIKSDNKGRCSLSYYIEGIKDYINDSLYKGASFFDGSCIKYFWTCDDTLSINNELIINGLGIEFLAIEEAKEYLRTNTNMTEIEEGKFEVSKGGEMMGILYKPEYIIL